VRRVLVLGGYGAFGARVAERLARESRLELVVAGRSLERAKEAARQLSGRECASVVVPARMDAANITGAELLERKPTLLINASGPYQGQDYRLARACIAAGVHYIDLADARGFVTGIGVLDQEAKQADVIVVSGASTVPALSAAAIDAYAPQFAQLKSASIVISPGNSFDPGLATTQSILSTLGRPFALPSDGRPTVVHGWQRLQRRHFPGLGGRWLGACNTPDLDLLPQRFPGLRTVEVFAALEVGAFHLALWGLSGLVRAGLIRQPGRLAAPLLALKRAMRSLGSDVGGMAVTLEGEGRNGARKRVEWSLIARRGHGPFIPAMPSVILAKRLLAGTLATRGAMPCLGLFTLAEFLAEVADLDIVGDVA
jgi:saccharopine dehydrogenase-like NADP-dependent oxidoreductase